MFPQQRQQSSSSQSPYRQEVPTPAPRSTPASPTTSRPSSPILIRSPSQSQEARQTASADAPTPTPTPPAYSTFVPSASRPLPTPPLQQEQQRPKRTVSTLTRRQCWICYESSDEELTGGKKRQWVHACRCTLVAHPECLLEWVTQYQTTHKEPPHCPVCSAPYLIREERSVLLEYYKKLLRRLDRTSLFLAVSGGVGGVWAASAAYSCWAIRMWAGDRVASALLVKQSWPLSYYLNLPLIPITLLLARTPLIDSLLPFLPLTLILSTSSPYHPLLSPPTTDVLGLNNLAFQYPPSPTLTLCLLPWARILYLRARRQVFDSVLGRRRRFEGLAGLMAEMEEAEGEEGAAAGDGPRLEVVAEVEVEFADQDEERVNGAAGVGAAAAQGAPVQEQVAAPPERRERLRVGLSRLTNLVVGALLFPAISAGAGAALFYLATRSSSRSALFLRKILGLTTLLSAGATTTTSTSKTTWLKVLSGSRPISTSAIVDPVWVRNTIGGGLVLIMRDLVQLTAGVLELKRKESRRVVGRPFDDNLELDDGSVRVGGTGAGGGPTMSGGRDRATGREAVVHANL